MPLLDLKTDLKSIKYGHDRPGGGSSNQPYIKTDINTVDSGINKLRLTSFDDGLVRGGVVGAINASVVDTLRIGKFFTDFPKGPLFLVKQVGLQMSNPQLEHVDTLRTDRKGTNKSIKHQGFFRNAANAITNAATAIGPFIANTANKIENKVGPTRIYNLGVNTLSQIPLNAIGGHVVRHGFLPIEEPSKYYSTVVFNNNFYNHSNRLVGYANTFALGGFGTTGKWDSSSELTSYLGGPGSVYGIGNTTIRKSFDTITNNWDKITGSLNFSKDFAGYTRDSNNQQAVVKVENKFFGASNYASSSFSNFISFTPNALSIASDPSLIRTGLGNNIADISDPYISLVRDPNIPDLLNANDLVSNGPSSYPDPNIGISSKLLNLPNLVYGVGASIYKNVKANVDALTNPKNVGIYETILNSSLLSAHPEGILPKSINNPTYTNGYGNVVKVNQPWDKVTREKRVGSGRQDSINLTPIFSADAGTHDDTVIIGGTTYNINDLVKFRIQAIDTDTPTKADWMIFRAYITDLSDDTTATWNEVKYAGRGDKFYIYDGFSRKMSVSFKVAALSAKEMAPMYQKLNFLMSNLMPDYKDNLMRGPLMRMTIGNWIDGQLCKFDSVSYKIPQDSPWEISLNGEELILPHIVEVTISFTPIGSQTRNVNELPRKEDCVSNIAQNWNGATKGEPEYIVPCAPTPVPPPPTPVIPPPVVPPPVVPPPVVPPKKTPPYIAPAHDQSTGTALSGLNNPGKQPKFATPAQETAYLKARGLL